MNEPASPLHKSTPRTNSSAKSAPAIMPSSILIPLTIMIHPGIRTVRAVGRHDYLRKFVSHDPATLAEKVPVVDVILRWNYPGNPVIVECETAPRGAFRDILDQRRHALRDFRIERHRSNDNAYPLFSALIELVEQ